MKRIEFLSLAADNSTAKVLGIWENGVSSEPSDVIPLAETALERIIETGQAETAKVGDSNRFCAPLIGAGNNVLGMILIDGESYELLPESAREFLDVLTTLIGISFGNIQGTAAAMFDPLTGLYLRRQFEVRLQEEMMRAMRYREMLAIVAIDMDNFKSLSETYGARQGDTILQEFASVLNLTIRKYVDIPCRYGGSRFIVILPKSDLQGAKMLAERVRRNCEEYEFTGRDKSLKVTVSGGVAAFDYGDIIPMEKLVQRAMEMVENAKEEGSNRVLAWE